MRPDELKITFIEMRARGLSFDAIVAELKVARATLFRWHSKLKTEIDAKTLAEREKIVAKFELSENQRFWHMCAMYKGVVLEVERSKLGSAPSDRLMRMALTLDARISKALNITMKRPEPAEPDMDALQEAKPQPSLKA